MTREASGFMPNLIGPIVIQDDGSVVVNRLILNFVGFDIESDEETDTITFTPKASTSDVAGTMSAADKAKLDGIQKQGTAGVMAALEVDWDARTTHRKTLAAGANTITFANATSGKMVIVSLTGAASTVTWPAGIAWAGGTPPTQTASGKDVYTFVHDGEEIVGSVVQDVS